MEDINLEEYDLLRDQLFITPTPTTSLEANNDDSDDEGWFADLFGDSSQSCAEIFPKDKRSSEVHFDLTKNPPKYQPLCEDISSEDESHQQSRKAIPQLSTVNIEELDSMDANDLVSFTRNNQIKPQNPSQVLAKNETPLQTSDQSHTIASKNEAKNPPPINSKKRKFKDVTSDEVIDEMERKRFASNTEKKIKWAVGLYQNWRSNRMLKSSCPIQIIESSLDQLNGLAKEKLAFSLSRFITEITKINSEEFPGRTLYEIIVAIQFYLEKHKLYWKILDEVEFQNFRFVLDNTMKDRASKCIGIVKKQAEYIPYELEERLWSQGILGEDTPQKLVNTVLFLIGLNCCLRAGEEHYALRRVGRNSQFSFKYNDNGIKCLVYTEDPNTKTNKGGLRDQKKERKLVWVYPSKDPSRCPVRLLEKYMNLCPESPRDNLYLRPLVNPKPKQWYTKYVIGINKIRSMVKDMFKSMGADGHFTNHSLRRTCVTRMFRNNVSTTVARSVSGHQSDAIEAYRIPSEGQRQEVSEVLGQKGCQEVESSEVTNEKINLGKVRLANFDEGEMYPEAKFRKVQVNAIEKPT